MGVDPNFEAHKEATDALGIQPDPIIEAEGKEPAKPAVEEPAKPEEKPEKPAKPEDRKPSDEPEEGEDDDEDDSEDDEPEGDDKGANKPKKVVPLARLKAEKKLRKETEAKLADAERRLTEKPAAQNTDQAAVTAKVRDFAKKVAEKHGSDPEVLSDFAEGIMALVKDLSPKEKQELPEDVKKDLEALGIYKLELKEKEQVGIFNTEYNDLEPELLKLYPNADKSVLAQAKEELYKLARSKDFHTLPLDSVFFRNRSVFDTILKVAKGSKSGEAARGDMRDPADEEEIDFTAPDMSPEKLNQHTEKQNQKRLNDTRIKFT